MKKSSFGKTGDLIIDETGGGKRIPEDVRFYELEPESLMRLLATAVISIRTRLSSSLQYRTLVLEADRSVCDEVLGPSQ